MRTTLLVFYSAFIAVAALIALTSTASKGNGTVEGVRPLCTDIECILKRDGK